MKRLVESLRCFGCREENHVIRNCPKRRKGQHEYRNKPGSLSKQKAALAGADGKITRILVVMYSS